MSVFKKTCFECGAKVDILFQSKCEDCFVRDNPPIKEIKPISLKICNMCGKIHYKNGLFTLEEIENMIEMITEKNMVLNENYKLNNLFVNNFELNGNKISFDIEADCDLIVMK